MVWIEALIPFEKGEVLSTIHQVGMVERTVSPEKIITCHLYHYFYVSVMMHRLINF